MRACLPAVLRASDSLGLAREDAWSPGEDASIPFVPRDALPLDTRDELGEDEIARLFRARGDERDRVLAAADSLRREVCGDEVSYVVTRNIQYTNVCYFRCGFCAFSKGKLAANLRGAPYLVPHEEIVRRCEEAWDRGATESLPPGRDPSGVHRRLLPLGRPGDQGGGSRPACARVLRARDLAGSGHARAPLEDYLTELRDAGLSSLPGTAAEILDDEVRRVICPDKVTTAQWLQVHDVAHRVGLRSNVTMMFGHVEGPRNWARHLLHAREQQRSSGGFTEFVPLPFVHMEAPMWLRGQARSGPTFGETLLVHAVARLALHPWITNIQVSWVKLGAQGVAAALRAGVNDLGGTLMNESISRSAGAEHGQEFPPESMEDLIRSAGRIPRQRTTLYGDAPEERRLASFGAEPLAEPRNPPVKDARLVAPPRLVRPGFALPQSRTQADRRATRACGSTQRGLRRRARPPDAARRCSSRPSPACRRRSPGQRGDRRDAARVVRPRR